MKPKKTVIFDMDGVLVDSEPYHCKAWIKTYAEIGINIDEDYYFSKICGNHGVVSSRMVLAEFRKQAEPSTLNNRKEVIASEVIRGKIDPNPGAVALITNLKKNNYKMGLASSSLFLTVDAVLSTLNIKDHFSVIHGGESIKKGKPSPDIYLKTCSLLEAEPENCVVIEDTKSGIVAGKMAGMKVIGVLNGRNKKEDLVYADRVVDTLADVTVEMIESL